MAAHDDHLIGMHSTLDFTDHIPGLGLRDHRRGHGQSQTNWLTFRRHMFE